MARDEKIVRLLITFTICVMNLYFKIKTAKINGIYKRIDNSRGATRSRAAPSYELVLDSTHSKLPHLDGQMRFYDVFHHLADWYLLSKNIFICLLRHKSLAHLRYLDCFMLGRLLFNGRAIGLAPFCACYEAIVWLVWRFVMLRKTPEFRLSCIEFLLDKQGHEPFWLAREAPQVGRGSYPEYHSALLEYQDPFEMYPEERACQGTNRRPPFKLRPNRTRKAWIALARATLIYYAIATAMIFGVLLHFIGMSLPVAITRKGFALNYRLCIQSLVDSPNTSLKLYGHFLKDETAMVARPQIVRNFIMPYTDLVNFNFFHILRITLEMLETSFLQLEVVVGFTFGLFVTMILSKDVSCYSQSIVGRMERLVANLRWRRELQCAWESFNPRRHKIMSHPDRFKEALSIRNETSDIQAQISDMFTMLDSYNKYMSLQCLCFLIFWLCYSAMVSSWIFLPGNDSPKIEWYAIHCFATLYLLLLLNFMTQAETSCHRLYNLISVAMALGEGDRFEMSIWISLSSFYKPRPLYCFTMLGSIKLTHLSGIQLLIWLFSVLILASSFFGVHNIK